MSSRGISAAGQQPVLGGKPVRWLARSLSGQGKILGRSLGVKRWGARARIAAIRERSRRVDQMCVLAWKQSAQGTKGAVSAKMPRSLALSKPDAFRKNNTIASRSERFRAARSTGPQYWIAPSESTRTATDDRLPPELAATPLSGAFFPLPEEPAEWTMGEHDPLGDSAAAAGAVCSLFMAANEGELASLMRLVAQGEIDRASQLARRILGARPAPETPKPVPLKMMARMGKVPSPSGPDRQQQQQLQQESLSPRERKVLRMISQGLSNRQIAETSSRSLHTVDTQVKNIFRKLAVKSRAQAVREGMQKGLLDMEACG